MFEFEVDLSETRAQLTAMRKKAVEQQKEIVERGQQALQYLARSTVLSGSVPGFASSPASTGNTATEGLFNTLHDKGKRGVIGTSWHPLANAFENWKDSGKRFDKYGHRDKVKWLLMLNKDFRAQGVMERVGNMAVAEIALAGGGE